MYFQNYGLTKNSLDKYLKSAISQYPSTTNMVRRQNTFQVITAAPLSYLLITDKDIEFQKVPLSDMQNVMTLC